MNIDSIKRIVIFLSLCLVQVLMFNRIQLFGCATPLLYVYYVILFPRDYPKWSILLQSFALGMVIDTFSNTPGVAMGALTLIGALQPYLLNLFVLNEAEEGTKSSASSMGKWKFVSYASLMTFIYTIAFFTLETFSFFNWIHWLACVFGSTCITLVLIFSLESIRK
jgi:rod shape-determining protein MreD